MSIERAVQVPQPIDEVVAWFSRPGAVRRLLPPWLPLKVEQEARSLRDGTALLRLPAGVQWVARHQPRQYIPGRRFVDELDPQGWRSLPTRVLHWRHEHLFEPVGTGHTRVVDRIDSSMPASSTVRMLAYRHRQLLGDLAAHQQAADAGLGSGTVAITGSSGLVGQALAALLSTGGHRVIRLVRSAPAGPGERLWDPANPDPRLLAGCDAVIHLAGASIFGRFTKEHRHAVESSRIQPTARLARLAADSGVETFISASAIGYYGGAGGDQEWTEEAAAGSGGDDFLSQVVRRWEAAAQEGSSQGMRRVQVRTGIVLDSGGGMLAVLRPLYAAGLGGKLGHGRQWMSWIGLDDLLDIYLRALWDRSLSGPVNAVSPHPVRNERFSADLAATLHRPAVIPVPQFAPRLVLGRQGAQLLAMADQRVVPDKLLQAGHRFRTAQLPQLLAHTLGRAE